MKMHACLYLNISAYSKYICREVTYTHIHIFSLEVQIGIYQFSFYIHLKGQTLSLVLDKVYFYFYSTVEYRREDRSAHCSDTQSMCLSLISFVESYKCIASTNIIKCLFSSYEGRFDISLSVTLKNKIFLAFHLRDILALLPIRTLFNVIFTDISRNKSSYYIIVYISQSVF